MKIAVSGSDKSIELSSVFERDFNEALVQQVLVAYQANARQATKKQKTRSEVAGGGAKPWKQKGTGRARAGTRSSPIWRSGGVTFAARADRNYSKTTNKKMYKGAMQSIFAELFRKKVVQVVSDFVISAPKTKDFVSALSGLNIKSKNNILVLVEGFDKNVFLSSRNLFWAEVLPVNALNPESLLRVDNVVITAGALKKIEELLK